MTPTQTAHRQPEEVPPLQTGRLKAFIHTRLARGEPLTRIANAVRSLFEIPIEPEQIIPFWRGEITLPTQTGHRQDKESVQIPADAVDESLFTRVAGGETAQLMPPVISEAAMPEAGTEATQTGHRQDNHSPQIPADQAVAEPIVTPMARGETTLEAVAAHVKAKLGIAPDPAPATQTGRRQDQKTEAEKAKTILTDAEKAFIVRGLARYETPTRVAAAVKAEFGIEIDRRQVFAYDPTGSRPPARRWIDLYAATRAQFLRDVAAIGVAQKVVRLRMLDRFANRADEGNYTQRAAKFLEQAAKECGGFYERYARPKAADAPARAVCG